VDGIMHEHLSVMERASKVFTPALHLYYPLNVVGAEGIHVVAENGRRYMDFSSGLAVLPIGHCHPEVQAAARGQLERLIHTGGVYFNETTVYAAERLVGVTPSGLDSLFFSNSGAEAVEGALKLARYVTGRQGIISFTGAFHGRTLGAVSITTSSARYRTRYHPLLPSVYQTPYPSCFRCPFGRKQNDCELECLAWLKAMLERVITPEEVAAVIIEPVLGEGGYMPAPRRFLRELHELCSSHGMLLIFDEVQSGMGRTGSWFAADHYGVTPDIMTVAKGIASGLPLSAVVSRHDLMDKWPSGAHGTTFGGNPVSCAAAIATIEVIRREGLLKHAAALGEQAIQRLKSIAAVCPVVGDVRGFGFMIGIELVSPDGHPCHKKCDELLRFCFERELILINCGLERNVIRFIPPLITSEAELAAALDILAEGIDSLS
jgi:4-aminobutyrate aminotransferase